MSDFTKGTISDIPDVQLRAPQTGWGLAQALRDLAGEDALFIPAKDGEGLARAQTRASSAALSSGSPGTFRTRRDHERNGVWVFLRRNSAA